MTMLGMRIAALRRQAGMTQKELARQIHVSPGTIGNYETGLRQPSLTTLTALAQIFRVSVDDLLMESPDTAELTYGILERCR